MDQINYLPDHILAEIFGNLSPQMIKCCTLVCKRWNNVIGTSKEMMRMFKLNLRQKSIEEIQEAKNLQRNHQAAEVCFKNESLDVVSRHNLKSLSLTAWDFDEPKLSLLIKTLNNLPLLRYLDLRLYRFLKDYVSDDHEKLKNNFVELTCNLEIIHLFDCCTVEQLKLIWEKADGVLKLKFSLKKLEIWCQEFHYYESLIKFLDRHKNSLTHLNLGFHTEPEFGIELIHKFALENIVNLKNLEMGHIKNEEGDFYNDKKLTFDGLLEPTEITRNLESLSVNARSNDMNENKRFYDMFPNLKRCEILLWTDDCSEILECINERCLNIEILEIGLLDKNSKINFPKLKEFTVHSYRREKHLCDFIRRHSQTLEKIVIKEEDIGFNLVANEISNCLNLNHLEIYCLSINLTVLKAFNEISRKLTPFTLKVPSSKGSFKFPDDKAIWDEEVKAERRESHYRNCDVQ